MGCGNGGMTAVLLTESRTSCGDRRLTPLLSSVAALGLENVEAVEAMTGHYQPIGKIDWIVMFVVLEYLRRPQAVATRCLDWLAPGRSLLVASPRDFPRLSPGERTRPS